jgi:AcrR family transcriptional regulator
MSHLIDEKVLRAAAAIMSESGWHGVTLEAVADRSGISRATLYRWGITRDAIAASLAEAAAAGWKSAIWPALTAPGTAAERLELAVRASCAAIDQHARLLGSGPNPVVDLRSTPPVQSGLGDVFVAPFARLLLDGAADGSLARVADPTTTATAIFAVLTQSYLALRSNGGTDAMTATNTLVDLILAGSLPR